MHSSEYWQMLQMMGVLSIGTIILCLMMFLPRRDSVSYTTPEPMDFDTWDYKMTEPNTWYSSTITSYKKYDRKILWFFRPSFLSNDHR